MAVSSVLKSKIMRVLSNNSFRLLPYQKCFSFRRLTNLSHIDFATDIVIWSILEVNVAIIAGSLPMLGPIFLDRRGPESIICSIRSILSLRSAGPGSISNSIRFNKGLAGGVWMELEGRSETTVARNNSDCQQSAGIHVKKTFHSSSR
jgi:hypothetical protein